MPRYFFHAENGGCLRDEEGETLADDQAACAEAVTILAEILPMRGPAVWEGDGLSVLVRGEDNRVVGAVTASGVCAA